MKQRTPNMPSRPYFLQTRRANLGNSPFGLAMKVAGATKRKYADGRSSMGLVYTIAQGEAVGRGERLVNSRDRRRGFEAIL